MQDLLRNRPTTTNEVLSAIDDAPSQEIGAPDTIKFLGTLARRLMTPSVRRSYPELASLGFFLRNSELIRLVEAAKGGPDDVVRVPRGLHFHIPPSNVDTVFVYSWALSLISGNPNIVRISERCGGAARLVLDEIDGALQHAPNNLRATQWFLAIDHSEPAMADFSSRCAQRVIWGGDEAVRAIRQHPLDARGAELTFPDRTSLTVLNARFIAELDSSALDALAAGFVNDVWWFDQAACSSPRTLVWVGNSDNQANARRRFLDAVHSRLEAAGLGNDPAMAMQRRVSLYGVALNDVDASLDLTRSRLGLVQASERFVEWMGAGAFVEIFIEELPDLANMLKDRDQTMTHAGFQKSDLETLVRNLGPRSVDRVVGVGSALKFGRFWDGFDLLGSMTRHVTVAE